MHTADGEKRATLVYRLGHWERVVGSIETVTIWKRVYVA